VVPVEITGPHETAEVELRTPGGSVLQRGLGKLAGEVPPGEYEVVARFVGASERRTLKVERGDPVEAVTFEQHEFRLHSAVPLEGTVTSRETHQRAAEEYSSTNTWDTGYTGNSSLFILVRSLNAGRHPRFATGLEVLDDSGRLLAELKGKRVSAGEPGCVAFRAQLPPGGYLLRRAARAGETPERVQPLYLCAGWQTEVYVPATDAPSLRLLSLRMPPFGARFVPASEEGLAAEAILEGLRRGRNLAGSETMINRLLEAKFHDPFLGILGATALCLGRNESRSPERRKDLEVVLDHLERLVDGHPDVRAMRLLLDETARSIPFPPLLRANLRPLRRTALQHPALVPPGSLTDIVIATPLALGSWTAWRSLVQAPSTALPAEGPAVEQHAALRRLSQTPRSRAVRLEVHDPREERGPLTPSSLFEEAGVPLRLYRFTQGAGDEPTQEREEPLLAVSLVEAVGREYLAYSGWDSFGHSLSLPTRREQLDLLFPPDAKSQLAAQLAGQAGTSTLRVTAAWDYFRESPDRLEAPQALTGERYRVLRAAAVAALRRLIQGKTVGAGEAPAPPAIPPVLLRQEEFYRAGSALLRGSLRTELLKRGSRHAVAEALLLAHERLSRCLTAVELRGGVLAINPRRVSASDDYCYALFPAGRRGYLGNDLQAWFRGEPEEMYFHRGWDPLANVFESPEVLQSLRNLELWVGQVRYGGGAPERAAREAAATAAEMERAFPLLTPFSGTPTRGE
jgi:hypothetical protein